MDTTDPRMGRMMRAGLLGASALLFAASSFANSQVGAWAPLNTLPFYPVHAHMLPTSKVLIWPGDGGISGDDAHQLDPVTQALSLVPKAGYDLFCSGHSFLPDGSLFVAGGHIVNDVGLAKASLYDPVTSTWRAAPDMNAGRWYPSVTTLGNGDAVVVSGSIDTTVGVNKLPQVYERATNTWRNLTTAQLLQPTYPRMVLAPDGRVLDVAPTTITRALDTSGTGQWSAIATRVFGDRDYGSGVVMDGKVMVIGGGDPPINSAEILDLNQATPQWTALPPMAIARRQLNATLLADGTVLVTGGTSGAGFNNQSTPVYPAELWDPATGKWTTMASASVPRLYHSSATLLPDGRVLTTGGNGQMVPEAFSPPYLFKGARPTLTGAPTALVGYGTHFTVQTDQADSIAKVTLIRLGSVTHAFDWNQRLNTLAFTRGTGSVDITAPSSGNLAPPGHYLLFVVNSTGVPSAGAVVQLGGTAAPPPPPPPPPPPSAAPTITTLSPSSAPAGRPGFTLSVAGSGFLSGAAVNWNGSPRQTAVASSTRVTAQLTASDIGAAGTAAVTVSNPGTPASNTLSFIVDPSWMLTVTKSGSDANKGTITSSPAAISCGSACSATFTRNSSVTLTVRVTGNARFGGWGGACTGTATTCTVPMVSDQAVTATFVRR